MIPLMITGEFCSSTKEEIAILELKGVKMVRIVRKYKYKHVNTGNTCIKLAAIPKCSMSLLQV